MRFLRFIPASLILAFSAMTVSPAMAQIEGEHEPSINTAYSAILDELPREGDLIMSPFVSSLSVRGEAESKQLIDDPDVPGHKALRVKARKGSRNWDTVVRAPIGPAVEKGDLLVMVYYLRVEEGSGEMPFNVVQLAGDPYTPLIQGSETVTGEWVPYVASGRAPQSAGQNKLDMQMHVANASHTIDFGPVFVLNLGQ